MLSAIAITAALGLRLLSADGPSKIEPIVAAFQNAAHANTDIADARASSTAARNQSATAASDATVTLALADEEDKEKNSEAKGDSPRRRGPGRDGPPPMRERRDGDRSDGDRGERRGPPEARRGERGGPPMFGFGPMARDGGDRGPRDGHRGPPMFGRGPMMGDRGDGERGERGPHGDRHAHRDGGHARGPHGRGGQQFAAKYQDWRRFAGHAGPGRGFGHGRWGGEGPHPWGMAMHWGGREMMHRGGPHRGQFGRGGPPMMAHRGGPQHGGPQHAGPQHAGPWRGGPPMMARGGGGGFGFGPMPGRGGPGPHNAQFAGGGPVDRRAMADAIFRHLDTNHDGSITKAEFVSSHGRMHGPADAKSHGGDRDGAKKKAQSKKDKAKKGESKKKDRPKKSGEEEDDDD